MILSRLPWWYQSTVNLVPPFYDDWQVCGSYCGCYCCWYCGCFSKCCCFCHCWPALLVVVVVPPTAVLSVVAFSFLLVVADKNHTRMSASRVSSWFCSHPAGSYPRDQGRTIDPDQDRLFQNLTISPWHHSQVQPYVHPMTAHIFN